MEKSRDVRSPHRMTVEVIDDDVEQLLTIFASIIEAEVDRIQPFLERDGNLGWLQWNQHEDGPPCWRLT